MTRKPFACGDRVRLTERGVQAYPKAPKRRGTVCAVSQKQQAYVLWDGRRSREVLPFAIIEKDGDDQGIAIARASEDLTARPRGGDLTSKGLAR